jgi:type VI secretion system protein VasD
MRRRKNSHFQIGLLSLGLLLGACSDKPKGQTNDELLKQLAASKECKPPPLELFLEPDAELNVNERGDSMPVEVRVLLLRDREAFDQLEFETIWRGESEALKKDLMKSATLTVFPGKLKIHPLKSTKGVAYVALVGIFRRPEGDGWRYVVNVRRQNSRCARKDNLHTVIHARLVKNRISKPAKKRTKKK